MTLLQRLSTAPPSSEDLPAIVGPSTSLESANLDLLRSAAVSFVVLFHLALFFGGSLPAGATDRDLRWWGALGHWGVLMFFVHTCLVLMQSLERLESRRRPGHSLFAEFIARRCFRLLPLSAFTVLVVAGLRLPVGHLRDGQFFAVSTGPVDVIANLLLVQNLTHVESVEAPLWSLPFEMQMYLVLPAIFAFVRGSPNARRALGLWVAAFVLGLVWERHRVLEMPQYVPCFLAGVVAYKWPRRRPGLPFWLWPVVLAATVLAYLRWPSLAGGWICTLGLGLAIPQLAEMPSGLVRRACHYVARYSYGVYLSHFILIWLSFSVLAGAPFAVRAAAFVVLLVAVPVALYHLVESPMIRVGAVAADLVKAQPARLRWASGAVVGAVLLVVVGGLRVASGRRSPVVGVPAAPQARSADER